jgi:hypothetical protein
MILGLALVNADQTLLQLSTLVFLYVGPDQILPLTSAIGALIGLLLMFWHWVVGIAQRFWHALTGR